MRIRVPAKGDALLPLCSGRRPEAPRRVGQGGTGPAGSAMWLTVEDRPRRARPRAPAGLHLPTALFTCLPAGSASGDARLLGPAPMFEQNTHGMYDFVRAPEKFADQV